MRHNVLVKLLFVLLLSFCTICCNGVSANTNDINNSQEITATGYGLVPPNGQMVMARRAAVVDAQRNLLEQIKGVQVDSETFMENFVISSDVVRTQVNGLIKGAVILEEGETADGSYYIKLGLPMYGKGNSLAAVAIPAATAGVAQQDFAKADTNAFSKQELKNFRQAAYTGVIIDASGMGLVPTFSPVIYDENGRAIYGIRNIDKDFAIEYGMVEYAADLQKAAGGSSRAGDNPLVLKAVTVKGGQNSANKVNVIVSVADGDRILLANEQNAVLENCAVVFVK